MLIVKLRPVGELAPHVERVLARVFAQLATLLPDAELHHIGATSIPEAVTKGDVDVLVRVSSRQFPIAVDALKRHFDVKQPVNWTPEFASFGSDAGYELPLGVQVVVKDSKDDFLLFLRDYLITNKAALEEYNRLKVKHAREGAEGYWRAKNEFLEKILGSMMSNETGRGCNPLPRRSDLPCDLRFRDPAAERQEAS
jgi:GrpB-like predicted nucleotidyltransferase (UPF0157 family)